jgi:hypothetical protein
MLAFDLLAVIAWAASHHQDEREERHTEIR